ncbi:MAG TPA: Sec-independent protein translocase protein TatB [Steroidobacteraceae bacterium]|jgi:sec-independent protein translocase protein TatB
MFDVGFSEILVIFVLALIVLGPERLPKVAAQVGKILGRARAMARQFREQLEEEITLEERKKSDAKAIKPIEMPPPAQDAASQPPEVQAAAAGADAPEGGPAHAGGRDESAQPGYQATGVSAAGATGSDPSHDQTQSTATSDSTQSAAVQPSTTPWVAEHAHDMASHEPVVEMESGHVDLTHEAWPHAAPVPPPEVAAVFGDQLLPAEPETHAAQHRTPAQAESSPRAADVPASQPDSAAAKTDDRDSAPAKDSSSQ